MSDVNIAVVIVAFALYTLAIVAVGLYSARYARRSDEDYFLAGRSLGSWIAALSASASSESGWVTLGLVGWAFTEGVKAYWIIPGCLCGFAFNWFFVAGRMSDRARGLGALTLPDFFAFNFREKLPLLRILSVIVIIVAMFLYVSAQFAAAGKAFGVVLDYAGVKSAGTPSAAVESEEATAGDAAEQSPAGETAPVQAFFWRLVPRQWGSYQSGVLLGALIVLIYTISGGFRAVCWTDFFQALLMVGTLFIFPVYLLWNAGGWAFIAQHLGAHQPEMLEFGPRAGVFAFVGFLFGHGALGINFGYPGQPHVLVRFMALRSRRDATLAGVIALVWGALVYWGAVTVGLFARATAETVRYTAQAAEHWTKPMMDNQEIYGELGLVLSSLNMLPALMSGLVLAAVLAAICSTADSQIVVAASSAANDLYARLVKRSREASHMLVNRVMVGALGVLAALSVLSQEVRVYDYVLKYGWAVLGAAFGPQVILILFWKRESYVGCLLGMLVGFATALLWAEYYDASATGIQIYNLPLAFVAALVVNVLVSLILTKRTDADGPSATGADFTAGGTAEGRQSI